LDTEGGIKRALGNSVLFFSLIKKKKKGKRGKIPFTRKKLAKKKSTKKDGTRGKKEREFPPCERGLSKKKGNRLDALKSCP